MEYIQDTKDLDYASPAEQEEYARWSDLVEVMLDSQESDVSELQDIYNTDDYDDNTDDEDLSDCGSRW